MKLFYTVVGPSSDANSITEIDSIRLYGKTKEVFGWPDDVEDLPIPPPVPTGDGITAIDKQPPQPIYAWGSPETDPSQFRSATMAERLLFILILFGFY